MTRTLVNWIPDKRELELLELYEDYVRFPDGLDPNAPKEAKEAYEEALREGQRRLALLEKENN